MKWRIVLPMVLCFHLAITGVSQAQTSDPALERLELMLQRMQEQMMRGFERDTSGRFGDTQFFFRVDTLGNDDFFRGMQIMPFDSDSSGFMTEFERFFRQLDGMSGDFDRRYFRQGSPSDDGALRDNDDDLLPEERLRLEEQQQGEKAPEAPAEQRQPAPAKKSKKSTIRI